MNQSTEIREREMKTITSGCKIPVFVQQNDGYVCNSKYLTPAFAWGFWKKLRNTPGRIRGAPGNILTNRELPNTNVATAVSVYSVVML
jgi:hypothetical protein